MTDECLRQRKLPGKCDGVCDRQGEEVEKKLACVAAEMKKKLKTLVRENQSSFGNNWFEVLPENFTPTMFHPCCPYSASLLVGIPAL